MHRSSVSGALGRPFTNANRPFEVIDDPRRSPDRIWPMWPCTPIWPNVRLDQSTVDDAANEQQKDAPIALRASGVLAAGTLKARSLALGSSGHQRGITG